MLLIGDNLNSYLFNLFVNNVHLPYKTEKNTVGVSE